MRVVIAEDQALLREGIARLFRDGGDEVVAAYGDKVVVSVDARGGNVTTAVWTETT